MLPFDNKVESVKRYVATQKAYGSIRKLNNVSTAHLTCPALTATQHAFLSMLITALPYLLILFKKQLPGSPRTEAAMVDGKVCDIFKDAYNSGLTSWCCWFGCLYVNSICTTGLCDPSPGIF